MNNTKNNTIKRILLSFLGINLMSLGLNILLNLNIGMGPFDSLTILIQQLFHIKTFSNASFTLHMFFALLLLALIKKFNTSISGILISILSIFITTRVIGVYEKIIYINPESFLVIIFFFILGFLILNLGLYTIAINNMIIAPYDKFIVLSSKIFEKDLGITRIIGDSTLLIIVILFNILDISHVTLSFGTIIITIFTGFNITLYEKIHAICKNYYYEKRHLT